MSSAAAARAKATPVAQRRRDQRRRRALLSWFDANARSLPWRRHPNPYRIWVSEVMLQQTRMAVVEPAYRKFLKRFPSLPALARASEEEVLSYWSGLGYYTRARSLHRAARLLHERGEKTFPSTWDEARKLPGVGQYTAAAVLSIAYGRPHAAIDGNVIRVLSRLDRLGRPDNREEPHRSLADRLLCHERPGDWNEALMELGETICLPRSPGCGGCPLGKLCDAHAADVVEAHPPPKARRAITQVGLRIEVLRDREGRILLERGAFPHLDHLWLPPTELLAQIPERVDFKHAIVHRSFSVLVETQTLSPSALDKRARAKKKPGVERKVVAADALSALGRSSLLTKSLRHAGEH